MIPPPSGFGLIESERCSVPLKFFFFFFSSSLYISIALLTVQLVPTSRVFLGVR